MHFARNIKQEYTEDSYGWITNTNAVNTSLVEIQCKTNKLARDHKNQISSF
jgi:hypothetical protein